MALEEGPLDIDYIRRSLDLFAGGTGGIDDWLIGDRAQIVCERLCRLGNEPLSCSQLNQLLALSHQAEVSEGFFKFYWASAEPHVYDVTLVPCYHPSYASLDQILTVDQLRWGLYRLYVDALLFYGTIENGYRELRNKDYQTLIRGFQARRFDTDRMVHRGKPLPLGAISKDDRYLIAEQACKTFDPPGEEQINLLMILRGAWQEHTAKGGGRITARDLIEGASVLQASKDQKQQFLFAADDMLDSAVESEEDLLERYESVRRVFNRSREVALRNSELSFNG